MFNRKINNQGVSMPIIILLIVLILGISGGVYYFYFYNKSYSSFLGGGIKCEDDQNGCDSLKELNKLRKEAGLSEIKHDSNLCYTAKDVAKNLITNNKDIESVIDLTNYLGSLINDKKYDTYLGGRNTDNKYKNWNDLYVYARRFEGNSITQQEINYPFNKGNERFDKGCIRFSEIDNNNFYRVVILGDSKSEK